MFIFHFHNIQDKASVWANRPWNFNNYLLMLEKAECPEKLSTLKFKYVEFWVQIYNVPISFVNYDMVKIIVENVGPMVETPFEPSEYQGKCVGIKIRVDTFRPLKRGTRMWFEEYNKLIQVYYKYERLP